MRALIPYWTQRNLASDLASDFFGEADRFFDQGFYDERSFSPATEIVETDENFTVDIDLPGIKREDIKIEVKDNVLTVSGERKREAKHSERVQRYERSYGFFKRSFHLPSTIDADKAEARYENGVLELILPKTVAAKPRLIEVKTS